MTSDPAELYQQAQGFIREGSYEQAEFCYRRLIALLPDVPQPHFDLASLLEKMGKNSALIVNHYEMFIHLAVENPDLNQQIAQAQHNIQKLLDPAPSETSLASNEAENPILDLPDDRIIVDKRGNGHFTKLGDAIANNTAGLPIHVRPGRYNETIMTTDPNLELEIVGPVSGEPAILMSARDHCLYIDCLQAEISNLTISNSSAKAAVEVVGGQVSFKGCEFLDCNTAGINVRYEARVDLKDGNVFFGGGTALQVADQAVLEVGSGGPNFFFSNMRGSIHATGDSKLAIKGAGFNYPNDLMSDETLGSLPYYGLGEVPVIWLQGNADAVIRDSKITGWGTLIQVEDQASVKLSGLESKADDGFSKQACTPEVFLWTGENAKAIVENSTFSSGVVGASGVVCSGQTNVKINNLTFGGEITMLKVDGATIEADGLEHKNPEGRNVVGLQAEGGRVTVRESYLPFVDIRGDIDANFNGVRFGGRGAKGNSFRGNLHFENCEFSGNSHFNGQMDLLNCSAQNLFGSNAWMSFYSGKIRIKGGQFLNHSFAVGCNFDILEAVFRFEAGYASPKGVIDILRGAYGKLEKCSIISALPKSHPALRIHRDAKVRQVENTLQGKVKMYR